MMVSPACARAFSECARASLAPAPVIRHALPLTPVPPSPAAREGMACR
jgi:hypothetical protein